MSNRCLFSNLLNKCSCFTAGKNINNLRYVDDTNLMAETKEEWTQEPPVESESEKAGSKLNIQKTKIMASRPIIS